MLKQARKSADISRSWGGISQSAGDISQSRVGISQSEVGISQTGKISAKVRVESAKLGKYQPTPIPLPTKKRIFKQTNRINEIEKGSGKLFINEIGKSNRLKTTEILIKRLKETYKLRPNVMEDLRKLLAGYRGEKDMKYYFQFLPDKDCLIIHNLRLYDGKTYFQMDYLILTQKFALIVECKNYYGEVEIDSNFNQMIRKVDEKVEGYSNPISQAKRHQRQLQKYFQLHNLPPIPIEFIIIFSSSSTILKGSPAIRDKVIHSHSFLEKWDNLSQKYKVTVVEGKLLRKVSKNLLKNNTPESIDLLRKYGIPQSDLITGVQCPACEKFAMIRQKRKWFCPHCHTYDKNAHHQTVNDYFLLIKATITNKEFRQFANISSRETAAKMLVRMNLRSIGENRGRKYQNP